MLITAILLICLMLALAVILAPPALYARRPFVILGALVLAAILAPLPALAQAATVVMPGASAASSATLLNIPPLVWDEINRLVIGLVLAILLMAWKWMDAHNPLKKTQADQILRDALGAALTNGAKFGMTQLQAQEKKVGGIDVGNAAVAAGANYVIAQLPGVAKKLGYDVTTQDGQAAIIRMVTARVGDLMTGPHDAPASVPLPAEVQAPAAPVGTPS